MGEEETRHHNFNLSFRYTFGQLPLTIFGHIGIFITLVSFRTQPKYGISLCEIAVVTGAILCEVQPGNFWHNYRQNYDSFFSHCSQSHHQHGRCQAFAISAVLGSVVSGRPFGQEI